MSLRGKEKEKERRGSLKGLLSPNSLKELATPHRKAKKQNTQPPAQNEVTDNPTSTAPQEQSATTDEPTGVELQRKRRNSSRRRNSLQKEPSLPPGRLDAGPSITSEDHDAQHTKPRKKSKSPTKKSPRKANNNSNNNNKKKKKKKDGVSRSSSGIKVPRLPLPEHEKPRDFDIMSPASQAMHKPHVVTKEEAKERHKEQAEEIYRAEKAARLKAQLKGLEFDREKALPDIVLDIPLEGTDRYPRRRDFRKEWWARTMERASFMSFYIGMAMMGVPLLCVLVFLVLYSNGIGDVRLWELCMILWYFAFVIVGFHMRGQIRSKFGIDGTLVSDLLYWFSLGPFLLCQEARHVDRVYGFLDPPQNFDVTVLTSPYGTAMSPL